MEAAFEGEETVGSKVEWVGVHRNCNCNATVTDALALTGQPLATLRSEAGPCGPSSKLSWFSWALLFLG